MNEPDMPGKIIAQIASEPAIKYMIGEGSWAGPDWKPSEKNVAPATPVRIAQCVEPGS